MRIISQCDFKLNYLLLRCSSKHKGELLLREVGPWHIRHEHLSELYHGQTLFVIGNLQMSVVLGPQYLIALILSLAASILFINVDQSEVGESESNYEMSRDPQDSLLSLENEDVPCSLDLYYMRHVYAHHLYEICFA